MIDLIGCDDDLVVFIESNDGSWSFVYDVVESVSIGMSNKPTSHAIPYGTEITDNIMRSMDTITIDGVIGCVKCQSLFGNPSLHVVIAQLKKLADRMIYDREGFVTLTSNHWLGRFMILTDVDVKQSQDGVQVFEISTSWTGANLVGSIGSPNFIRGGIQY